MFVLLEHRVGSTAARAHERAEQGRGGAGADARAGAEVHWDLLVEAPDAPMAVGIAAAATRNASTPGADGVERRLPTWRLAECPLDGEFTAIPAERIQDHRPLYLEYEGEISGGRGWVRRLDRGLARVQRLSGDELVAVFEGARLRGRFEFAHDDVGRLTFRRATPEAPA